MLIRVLILSIISSLYLYANQIIIDYKNSFLNNQNIMLLIDPKNGNIVKANHKAAKFYGYHIKLLEKMNIKDINTFTKAQVQQEMINAKNEKGNYFIFNHRLADKKVQKVRVFSTLTEYRKRQLLFSTILPALTEQVYIDNFTKQLEKQVEIQIEDIKNEQKKNVFLLIGTVGILSVLLLVLLSIFFQKNRLSNYLQRSNKKLKEQKEEFETIFEYAQDGIAVTDLDGKFKNVNNAFINLTDYPKEELLTKTCKELTALEYQGKNDDAIEKAIKNGHVENIEKVCVVNNNKRVSVNMSISLLPDNASMLLIIKDMTSLRLLEDQSKLASMGEMIGNIAHQWRQPLSIITTSASGLQLKSEMDHKVTKEDISYFGELIVKQANYLSNTIDNFRGFLKGERNIKLIEMKEVLDYTLSLVEASIKNHNIKVVPVIEDSITIKASLNELSEVFINIVNNAKDILKENIENHEDRFIFVSAYKEHNNVIIEFRDSGGGIKQEIITRVFEPYFTTKHKSVGTGLGLAMSDKIIREQYKGAIEVFNVEYDYNQKHYQGACFKVILPLLEEVEE